MLFGMNTSKTPDLNTIELLEAFWKIHWTSFSPSQRAKTRGRLIVMAASLFDCPTDGQKVVAYLRTQDPRKGIRRPLPDSGMEWVARYLQDVFLPPPMRSIDPTKGASSFELTRAAQWVIHHSKPLTDITDEDLLQLRTNLGGKTYNTRRTYWAIVESVLHWALTTRRMAYDPSIGLPKVKRILQAERMDRDRIPDEGDIWAISEMGREVVGEWFRVAVLLGAFGALRVGELVALRWQNIEFVDEGGLWIGISAQHRRFSKRHSEDGDASSDYAPPKGRIAGPGAGRKCYIPSRVGNEVREYVNGRSHGELLFLNSRHTPLSGCTFRNAWIRVIQTLPTSHRLAGITPHSMRHAGMSMWLRNGLDLKLIQSWGGWHSLKVMLDTYAALLPGAEEDSIALLEGRWSPLSTNSFPSAAHPT